MASKSTSSPFPHSLWIDAFCPDAILPQPMNHWRMHAMSREIRAKDHWKDKYKNPGIVAKWKAEIIESGQFGDLAEKMFGNVIQELAWVERMENEFPGLAKAGFTLQCDDKIVASKTAVSDELRSSLSEHVQKLYDSFGNNLDYHPGSDNKVIDLVHPSLFPLQYGKTVINTDSGFSIAEFSQDIPDFKIAQDARYSQMCSKKFQWLPTPMIIDPETNEYKFSSYINNLHPVQHKDLYATLEKVFNACLPGLNYTLARHASPVYNRVDPEVYLHPHAPSGFEMFGEYENEVYNKYEGDPALQETKLEELRSKRLDYIRELYSPYKDPETVEFSLANFPNVKVITKIAQIELTPESPSYPGGSWHIEGAVNEDIVATVIYYFSNDNITESQLSFRLGFAEPYYEQYDAAGVEHIWGLKDEDPLVRRLGQVKSETGKCVVWPNTYQHFVEPFELEDRTKPGSRKILCFFICDPYDPNVVATDKVPFQREDWWDDASLGLSDAEKLEIRKLNKEMPMKMEEAFRVRAELMEERSNNTVDYDNEDFVFNLCEH